MLLNAAETLHRAGLRMAFGTGAIGWDSIMTGGGQCDEDFTQNAGNLSRPPRGRRPLGSRGTWWHRSRDRVPRRQAGRAAHAPEAMCELG